MKQIRGSFHHKITCSTSSCTNKRKRQTLTTTILTVLCLTTQLPTSSYNSDAFLLSPSTRHPSFLTRDGDKSITSGATTTATATATAGICKNFSSKSLQLKPHSEREAYGIFQSRNDRYRLFQSSMTAESESEVKAEESLSVSVPASTSTSASASASASASVGWWWGASSIGIENGSGSGNGNGNGSQKAEIRLQRKWNGTEE